MASGCSRSSDGARRGGHDRLDVAGERQQHLPGDRLGQPAQARGPPRCGCSSRRPPPAAGAAGSSCSSARSASPCAAIRRISTSRVAQPLPQELADPRRRDPDERRDDLQSARAGPHSGTDRAELGGAPPWRDSAPARGSRGSGASRRCPAWRRAPPPTARRPAPPAAPAPRPGSPGGGRPARGAAARRCARPAAARRPGAPARRTARPAVLGQPQHPGLERRHGPGGQHVERERQHRLARVGREAALEIGQRVRPRAGPSAWAAAACSSGSPRRSRSTRSGAVLSSSSRPMA